MTPATPTEYGFDCTWGVELVAQDVGRWLLRRHITPRIVTSLRVNGPEGWGDQRGRYRLIPAAITCEDQYE